VERQLNLLFIAIAATRSWWYILKLKCTKFDLLWCSVQRFPIPQLDFSGLNF